jgi:anti-sigma factor RsiW
MPADTVTRSVEAELTDDEVADALPGLLDGDAPVDIRVVRHVESCPRCQAELAQYRRLLRVLRSLRCEVLEPSPGALAAILASVAASSERRAVRGILLRRSLMELGGLAAAAAAAGAGVVVLQARQRRRAS